MRLTSIKLSGFKSFADATNFDLPGQMVGVVGPNGCGKSNIMDAVRWVLGESRASELRGESMQDVIFNGSATRKAASRSSVELVFSNEDHRAGGQWATYSELAVKRVLTRDGTSSYFINNQAARRRDIQDIFLGTGLGPRAYAIIGQGMISRIIESRPEELRVFLEEAAGVSKYKERRRETESRLSSTRENLTRVEDILRELNSNLEKLEKQAEVARKYNELSAQATARQQQVWLLRRDEALAEAARLLEQIGRATNEFEAKMADLRKAENDLESVRQAQLAGSQALNVSQAAFYEAQAMVAKQEAEIRFLLDQKRKIEQQLAQIKEQSSGWGTRREDAQREIDGLGSKVESEAQAAAEYEALVEEQGATLPVLEESLRSMRAQLGEQRVGISSLEQSIKSHSAQSQLAAQQLQSLTGRQDRLLGERRGLVEPDAAKLSDSERQLALALEQEAVLQAKLESLNEELPQKDDERKAAALAAQEQSGKLAQLSARFAALKALQEKVMTEGKLKPWLEKHGLESLGRLWRELHTEPGWENALEAALRERLAAIKLSNLDQAKAFAKDAPPAKLAFYTLPQGAHTAAAGQALKPLLEVIRTNDASLRALLAECLAGVYLADSLDAALSLREKLPVGGAIVVKEGHMIERHTFCLYAPDSEQAGLLARQQEIENLEKQTRAQQLLSEEAKSHSVRLDALYVQLQQQYQSARAQLTQLTQSTRQQEVHTLQQRQLLEQFNARSQQLQADLNEVAVMLEEQNARREESEARFEGLDIELGNAQQSFADFETEVLTREREVTLAREKLQSLMIKSREGRFAVTSLQARRDELLRSIDTADGEIRRLAEQQSTNQGELFSLSDDNAQGLLQNAVAALAEREAELALKRGEADDLNLKYRALDEQRLNAERTLEPQRQKVTDLQFKEQAAKLNAEQFAEQLLAASADLQALASALPQGARPAQLQGELERLQREIAALGAVNLAALEELGTARERKEFLDAQYKDLTEAINTLEAAIKQIDLETRELLKGTFDRVNEQFGQMFPALFGGGDAKLVMTGDEILDSGVQVMAQPPGKRNSSIALLSGGEKALTAVALVFAIFQLNPAPFCLLDEVDAPLDDANTERFAKLVQRMSQETQFLFISHNKITMELAEQLIGVTMQEQGVSRVVAVDMAEAASFAEAA